jgi:hypothetical protein
MKNEKLFTRREFLKSGTALSIGVPLLGTGMGAFASCAERAADDSLFLLFKNPPNTAKPFVRWWWNGNKLAADEILRELDIMKDAGIGGVEINPIAFPGGDDLGIPSLEWLSPEWIEMIKIALKGAEERGIICDLIVGSGWPFGSEILEREEQTQVLTLTSRKVKGPQSITLNVDELFREVRPVVHSPYKDLTNELYSLQLAPLQMDSFAPATDVPFNPNDKTITVQIPEGEYILYSLVKVIGFQAVINGAPGAAGPVLNHYNTTAVEKFLNRMSDQLFPVLDGLKGFRAMFCDSMELEGANWCYDFPEEFKKRNGYDVTPYLPFVLYKVGYMGHAVEGIEITELTGVAKEEVDRVRYDFFVTCMNMVHDRFLVPFTKWCNKHNFKSRAQAYGREFHPLEASMSVDIPECETWIWNADNQEHPDLAERPNYTNVNKYVASASHLSGKGLVSCEEITNTEAAFNATLERIKITGDLSNLSGVTHSILHGFNYSPPEAPFPGWIRYGAYLNERNTWWPYFKLWAAYKARLSALLQSTEPFADIAVLHPLADMWTIHGPQRDPFPHLRYPEYQDKVWEAIHKNGNSCDYTSENIIQQSTVERGYLKYNTRKYNTLILIEVESMMPETAKALENFAKGGGKIIFIAKEPHKSVGLNDYKAKSEEVKQTIARLKSNHSQQVFTVDAPDNDVVAWFRRVQLQCGVKPYMEIDNPSPYINQIRHQTKDKDIFFVSNCDINQRISIKARFPESKGKAWLWNPETGESFAYPNASGNQLTIDLPPTASQLIVFDKKGRGEVLASLPDRNAGVELKGWSVDMNHIDGGKQQRTIAELEDWSVNTETRRFAGELIYKKQIRINSTQEMFIDLGKVYGVSEVTLNGQNLGCQWYGQHLYKVPENLLDAGNVELQIKVVTTLGNYFKATPENRIGHAWTRHQRWQPVGLIGPVKLI